MFLLRNIFGNEQSRLVIIKRLLLAIIFVTNLLPSSLMSDDLSGGGSIRGSGTSDALTAIRGKIGKDGTRERELRNEIRRQEEIVARTTQEINKLEAELRTEEGEGTGEKITRLNKLIAERDAANKALNSEDPNPKEGEKQGEGLKQKHKEIEAQTVADWAEHNKMQEAHNSSIDGSPAVDRAPAGGGREPNGAVDNAKIGANEQKPPADLGDAMRQVGEDPGPVGDKPSGQIANKEQPPADLGEALRQVGEDPGPIGDKPSGQIANKEQPPADLGEALRQVGEDPGPIGDKPGGQIANNEQPPADLGEALRQVGEDPGPVGEKPAGGAGNPPEQPSSAQAAGPKEGAQSNPAEAINKPTNPETKPPQKPTLAEAHQAVKEAQAKWDATGDKGAESDEGKGLHSDLQEKISTAKNSAASEPHVEVSPEKATRTAEGHKVEVRTLTDSKTGQPREFEVWKDVATKKEFAIPKDAYGGKGTDGYMKNRDISDLYKVDGSLASGSATRDPQTNRIGFDGYTNRDGVNGQPYWQPPKANVPNANIATPLNAVTGFNPTRTVAASNPVSQPVQAGATSNSGWSQVWNGMTSLWGSWFNTAPKK